MKYSVLKEEKFIREHPNVMGKLFANGALGCPCYLIMMYLQEHLVDCGWSQSFIGIPLLAISLAGAVGAWLAESAVFYVMGGILLTAVSILRLLYNTKCTC